MVIHSSVKHGGHPAPRTGRTSRSKLERPWISSSSFLLLPKKIFNILTPDFQTGGLIYLKLTWGLFLMSVYHMKWVCWGEGGLPKSHHSGSVFPQNSYHKCLELGQWGWVVTNTLKELGRLREEPECKHLSNSMEQMADPGPAPRDCAALFGHSRPHPEGRPRITAPCGNSCQTHKQGWYLSVCPNSLQYRAWPLGGGWATGTKPWNPPRQSPTTFQDAA